MPFNNLLPKGLVCASLALISLNLGATTVQFQTTLGNFEVNLYDTQTPITVDNFLYYVNQGSYQDTLVHRSVNNFIIQGGGFGFSEGQTTSVQTTSAIQNEPYYSNIRGTIAMAKLSGQANSATSQWFINTSNNSLVLDDQNSGFTVFGEVVSGMDVVDSINALAIANLPSFDAQAFSPALAEAPITNFTQNDVDMGDIPGEENLVYVTSIVILDGTENTIGEVTTPINDINNRSEDESGGGSLPIFTLIALSVVGWRKNSSKAKK